MPDEGGAFLEVSERHVPVEWQSIFLDVSAAEVSQHSIEEEHQGVMQQLDCDCDKVKCNCLKHCECNTGAGAGGSGAKISDIKITHEGKPASLVLEGTGTTPSAPDVPHKPSTSQQHKHQSKHHHHRHHHNDDNEASSASDSDSHSDSN